MLDPTNNDTNDSDTASQRPPVSAPQITSNGLMVQTDSDPSGSGLRQRTLTDPQSGQLIKQDVSAPKHRLKTKATRRLSKARY